MKKFAAAVLLSLVICGCSRRNEQPPLKAYAKFSDRLKAGSYGLFGTPCTRTERWNGEKVPAGLPPTECYRFGKPERMRGIWLYEFEASQFLEGQQDPPAAWQWQPNMVDLDFTGRARPSSVWTNGRRRAFYIDFVGRRMMYPFKSRNGGSDTIVNAERIIELREVKAPERTEFCNPKCRPFDEVFRQRE